MWVYSELGISSVFKIYLPAASGTPAGVAPHVATRTLGGQETILLVDDDPSLRTVARNILDRAGYTVLEAGDAPQAIALFEQHAVDLLLTDVVLPGASGPEFARALQARRPTLKVLFMSGYSRESQMRDEPIEVSRYVQKPITPELLARRVRAILDE